VVALQVAAAHQVEALVVAAATPRCHLLLLLQCLVVVLEEAAAHIQQNASWQRSRRIRWFKSCMQKMRCTELLSLLLHSRTLGTHQPPQLMPAAVQIHCCMVAVLLLSLLWLPVHSSAAPGAGPACSQHRSPTAFLAPDTT
jgi:hypothetical protein